MAALDLTPELPAKRRELVATYRYRDAAGVEVRQKIRYAPKDFRIRHRDPAGQWVYKAGPGPAVLYRLPELRQAIAAGATVFVVEGEKDCDRLAAGGLAATTNIEGAAQSDQKPKWRAAYTAQLAGAARVVLLPDHDEPGRAHMAAIAQALQGRVGEVRLLELPGLPAKGDVSDWLNQGHTVAELQALAAAAPVFVFPTPPDSAPAPAVSNEPTEPVEAVYCPPTVSPCTASGELVSDSPLLPGPDLVCAGTRLDPVDRPVLAARSHRRRRAGDRVRRRPLAPHRPGSRHPRPPRRPRRGRRSSQVTDEPGRGPAEMGGAIRARTHHRRGSEAVETRPADRIRRPQRRSLVVQRPERHSRPAHRRLAPPRSRRPHHLPGPRHFTTRPPGVRPGNASCSRSSPAIAIWWPSSSARSAGR